MKPSEAKHIKINGGPPSAMTANFLCSVAEDMPLNEREARLLAAKFEATPCYAEYSALCAIRDAAKGLMPFMGKALADGTFKNCVAPLAVNQAVAAFDAAWKALKQIQDS